MKIKTEELSGPALDWAVAKCESTLPSSYDDWAQRWPRYSTDWALGGPIIEREFIDVTVTPAGMDCSRNHKGQPDTWRAECEHISADDAEYRYGQAFGSTPLEAAMRCYVASKLGDEVDIPDELTK